MTKFVDAQLLGIQLNRVSLQLEKKDDSILQDMA